MTHLENKAWQTLDQLVTHALPYCANDNKITLLVQDVMRSVEHFRSALIAAKIMQRSSIQRGELRRQATRLKTIACRRALTLKSALQIHQHETHKAQWKLQQTQLSSSVA